MMVEARVTKLNIWCFFLIQLHGKGKLHAGLDILCLIYSFLIRCSFCDRSQGINQSLDN